MGQWAGLIWLRIGTGGVAVMNAVMNLRVPQNVGDLLTSRVSASQKGLCSMELAGYSLRCMGPT